MSAHMSKYGKVDLNLKVSIHRAACEETLDPENSLNKKPSGQPAQQRTMSRFSLQFMGQGIGQNKLNPKVSVKHRKWLKDSYPEITTLDERER